MIKKYIPWSEAFALVEKATAVSVESQSSELNYPSCDEDNGEIVLELNDDVVIILSEGVNKQVEVTEANGHLVFDDLNGDPVELALLNQTPVR